ncbi:transcriptional regulator with XRE-family HTH domain [Haloactinomyces albus]|uniref:Transcriptional regulator with XRE-family HTH domain n=2 Tax=Haloactinomyces albus TaxID=1352928 RepID=A0AAE3ZA98_9ACTN|nr:transcriptional regulator with XRE-family HTH domain [Haloactinomyces albus]
MSATYLSRLESGNRQPTVRAAAYLAERLGVTVESFGGQPQDSLTDTITNVVALSESELDAEAADRLADVLAGATDVDQMTRWYAWAQLVRIHEVLDDSAAERDALIQLNALSDELDRPLLRARARIRMAQCARKLGDAREVRRAVCEMLAIREQYALQLPASDLIRSKLALVFAEVELGDLAEAARLNEEVCGSLESTKGDLAAETFRTAAMVSSRQGNYSRAFAFVLEALEAIDSRDDLMLWIRLRLDAASLSMQARPLRLVEAQSFLESVEPLLKVTGTPHQEQELTFLQAKLAFHHGQLECAAEVVAEVEKGVELLSYRDRIRFKVLRCLLAIWSGDQGAGDRLKEIAAQIQMENMPDLAAEVWRAVAESAL